MSQVTLSHEFSGTIVELGAQVGAKVAKQNVARINFPN